MFSIDNENNIFEKAKIDNAPCSAVTFFERSVLLIRAGARNLLKITRNSGQANLRSTAQLMLEAKVENSYF